VEMEFSNTMEGLNGNKLKKILIYSVKNASNLIVELVNIK